jgi:1,4-dihydroxy-2-naphthoate octaprenyltransferase
LPGKATYWIRASRPGTLTIAIAPVLAGTGLAWAQIGTLDWTVFLLVLVGAALIQIGTNLHNDSADYQSGGDDPETRLGPARVTAQGWLTVHQVRTGAISCFCLAGVVGIFLVLRGGGPILLAGLASIAAGWWYSSGPRPIAYTALGEFFVLAFFGVVAVVGSYYLQVGSFSYTALLTGVIIGMPAAAVLVVNNYRDLDNDRRVGRQTVAVRFGRRASRIEYALLMILPFALLPILNSPADLKLSAALPFLALPWAGFLVYRFWTGPPGPAFNGYLVATARFQLLLAVLLVISWRAGAAWGG